MSGLQEGILCVGPRMFEEACEESYLWGVYGGILS